MRLDWQELFALSGPPLEIVLRGTVVYLGLFLILRVVRKREFGSLGMTDLLVVVLIADAAQNAMAGDRKSIGDGLLLVATIVLWSWALDWLGYHVPAFERLVRPRPVPLVRDGALLRRNMRRELVTEEELHATLRRQGVKDLADVRLAQMEADGEISVVTHDDDDTEQRPDSAKRRKGK